ncbi:ABC transporter permease [Allorhizocola rhizosphaerae]|uniref:ABC transporter permease n=1 Tax=Allorhizocola rhizosphaerae TaxID=1872709 RepID=UPI000E3C09F4|nr:ABC transporter permease subunit [Allorhizocola rhizosphaerae]
MLWLIWRQHRAELLTAVVLLFLFAVPIIVSGLAMHAEYETSGAAACVANPQDSCGPIADRFVSNHIEWANRLVFAAMLPLLAGVFIGAPLLAREFESGTWRLAFTQSVTRTRWLVSKLTIVGAGTAGIAVAFGLLFTWWRGPLNEIDGRLRTAAFVATPVSLAVVTVFAFAAGVLAGALLRRTIPAMAVALAVFLVVRIPLEESARPHYVKPLSRVNDALAHNDPGWRPTTDWVVENGWVDSAGKMLSADAQNAVMREIYGEGGSMYGSDLGLARYMAEHGIRRYTEYHPDSAFGAMLAIESALYLGLAAVLLAVAVWVVRRRLH